MVSRHQKGESLAHSSKQLSCFVAIGVGQGDAFFLKRPEANILVDGGRSVQMASSQLMRVIGNCPLNIVVCTHNDADHANGILGILQSGWQTKEVWLPGSWTYRLTDLLRRPSEFFQELATDIAGGENNYKGLTLETLGESYAESAHEVGESPSDSRTTLDEILSADTQDEWYGTIPLQYQNHITLNLIFAGFPWVVRRSEELWHLLLEALVAAQRIQQIAMTAYHLGTTIRWFEFGASSGGNGLPGVLTLLNACEISSVKSVQLSALKYLALTTANQESLVLHSPGSDMTPDVLFTADSDLHFSQSIPASRYMLVTAPHHGSETNANAYRRLQAPSMWVRSDGRSRTRPGPSFLSVTGKKFCTLCRGSNKCKQDVILLARNGAWRQHSSTRLCSCI